MCTMFVCSKLSTFARNPRAAIVNTDHTGRRGAPSRAFCSGPPTKAALLRRLQTRRVGPIVQIERNIGPACFPQQVLFFGSGWEK
jgi:hypothetical protein